MDYEKLIKGIKWTQNMWKRMNLPKDSTTYERLRERGDNYWLHLENMSEDRLPKEIITGFLNTRRWNCHLPRPDTTKGTEMIRNLKNALEQLPDLYLSLKNFRIEDMYFTESKLIDITRIYSTFRQIKPTFGPVPASKLMHMALPNLFIMWDDAIFRGYGVPRENLPCIERRVRSYASFLILMQENIHHIKETNTKGSGLTYQQLFQQINKQCEYNDLPITRLLDTANYAVGEPIREEEDRKKGKTPKPRGAPDIKCHLCIERTNLRLNKLTQYTGLFKPGKYETKIKITEVE